VTVDAATAAFRRLLAEGAEGGQAKVDALVALAQRTVFVATWTPGGEDYRTLINSSGQNALPIFTTREQLEEAGRRLGWATPDGSVPCQEIGARAAFRHLVAHDLGFLIVDIAADHTLEVERSEVEPLLAASRADSAGPFAAVGRISSTMLEKVKKTPRPMPAVHPPDSLPEGALPPRSAESSDAVPSAEASSPPPSGSDETTRAVEGDLPPAGRRPSSVPAGVTATAASPTQPVTTFGSGAASVTVAPLTAEPDAALLDALSEVLRRFPEVEWASYLLAARGPSEPRPTIGLRVDTSYRARVQDILAALRSRADEHGASVDVLLLDDPALVREARARAIVFFPWRRRPAAT